MKKRILYKSLAIFFAIYLPVLSAGIPLYKHYCKGVLEETSWFLTIDSCEDPQDNERMGSCCTADISCHSVPENHQQNTNDCCQDKLELLRADLLFTSKQSSAQEKLDLSSFFLAEKSRSESSFIPEPERLLFTGYYHPWPDGRARIISFAQLLC